MPKLILMRGLPGCGKTTRAKEMLKEDGNAVRVSRDAIREMLHFRESKDHKLEDLVTEIQKHSAACALNEGKNVIVDDTNLNPKTMESWKTFAKNMSVEAVVEDLTGTSLLVCLARDMERSGKDHVGAGVIERMALRYLRYIDGKDIVISDVDGTVADCSHRQHYVSGDKKHWDLFLDPDTVSVDSPRRDVIERFNSTAAERHIVVSARPEELREVTERWLIDNGVKFHFLIMRPSGDRRPDTVVKEEIYKTILSKANVLKVFDDRPSVIRMWRSHGLTVEDVGNGVEF